MFSVLGSICVGDKTSCGGTVVTGSPFSDVNGKPVARIGDKISCRKNCVIVTGNETEIIDGAPLALHGSRTSGQCTCISGQMDLHGDGRTAVLADNLPPAADIGIPFIPDTADLLDEDHWIEFQLLDTENKPIPNQKFLVIDPAGAEISGFVDERGFARVTPVKAGVCRINFPDLNVLMTVESCQP